MRKWILQWLGLDAWMRGIEQAVGEVRLLVQDRVLTLQSEAQLLREQNKALLDAFIALKVRPPEISTRKIPASLLVQQQTIEAFRKDREV